MKRNLRRAALLAAALLQSATPARAQSASNINAVRLLSPVIAAWQQPAFLSANLQEAISINNNSDAAERSQSVLDSRFTLADGSAVADGLGPRLAGIYQNAVDAGAPALSADGNIIAAFIQANGTATNDASFAKIHFNNVAIATTGSNAVDLRPFQTAAGEIVNFAPDLTAPVTNNPAFPSGHATFAYTQALLFAVMVPERYQPLVTRASEFANGRMVIGAHDPLDTIGGRILATYDVVQLLNNNPLYLGQNVSLLGGGSTTTSTDYASLFGSATTDLRNLLQQGCGSDIASCAAADSSDRFANPQLDRAAYTQRLTYGLPLSGPSDLPPVVPAGAEVLLKTRFPYLDEGQRRDVLATTELPSGVPLDDGSGWARLNLYTAATGYGAFNSNVTVTMNAALGGYNASDSWNNDISGSGGLTLDGSGTLTLSGADTFTGPTVINGGTLVITGSTASATTVNPGGSLSGSGRINAALINYGTVAPGNPASVLSVGTFTQGENGVLDIRLDHGRQSRLSVDGTATLAGTLRISPVNGFVPNLGDSFVVIEAGQRSGLFGAVDAPALPGGLFYQPLYRGDSVGIIAAAPLPRFARTANERAVADMLDRLRGDQDQQVQQALSALYPAEATGSLPAVLDRLAPQTAFGETLLGRQFADLLANQLSARVRALRAGAGGFAADLGEVPSIAGQGGIGSGRPSGTNAASGDPPTAPDAADGRLAGFVAGQIAHGSRAVSGAEVSHDFTAGGATLGFDYRIDRAWQIGVAGSYLVGGAGAAGGDTAAHAGAGSLYAATGQGPIDIDGSLSLGLVGYDTTRRPALGALSGTATASPGGRFAAFAANAGYHFARAAAGGELHWGPVGELRLNGVAVDGYRETGLASVSAHIAGRAAASVQSGIGAEAAFLVGTMGGQVTARLRATWRHEFADATEAAAAALLLAPSAPFVLHSRAGRDFAVVGAGLSGSPAAGVRLTVDYAGELGRGNETAHQLSLIARFSF